LKSFRVTRAMWWTTTTMKNRTWMTIIIRIVFDVVAYQLIVVDLRISRAINVLSRKLFAFRYVLNSFVDVFLFNSRKFRFVFESSFINCLTFVSFYASTIYHWKHLWKSDRFYNLIWLFEIASEIIKKEYEYEHISLNSRSSLFEYKHTPLRIDAHLRTFF
jgi:hypothetical protein